MAKSWTIPVDECISKLVIDDLIISMEAVTIIGHSDMTIDTDVVKSEIDSMNSFLKETSRIRDASGR